jgi:hypothetical protein
MSDEALTGLLESDSGKPRPLGGRTSLLFTALWCGYFLVAGWAIPKVLLIFVTLLAGMGLFSVERDSIPYYLFSHNGWLTGAAAAVLIVAVLVRHFVSLSDARRRHLNRVLVVMTIVCLPFVVAAFTFAVIAMFGPFSLIGKLPK